MKPVTNFGRLLGNDTADELATRDALLLPCTVSCSLSECRRMVSSKFFDTTDVPSVSTEELALPRYGCCDQWRTQKVSEGEPKFRHKPALHLLKLLGFALHF